MRKIFLIFIFIHIFSCVRNQYRFFTKDKVLMGTLFTIKVYETTENLSRFKFFQIADEVLSEAKRLENDMSEFNENSPISLASKFSGIKSVEVTSEIIDVITVANEISELTKGTFDITFKPLGWLWNVKKRAVPPKINDIKKALRLVNYKNIKIDKNAKTLFLKEKGMHVGLGGIAKGYAAKVIGEELKNRGIHNFIINAGGDLYVEGSKKGKSKNENYWTSGVQDPNDRNNFLLSFKIITPGAVVTSGDYERYFEYGGKKYHHIIDVRTGYPARGMKSVTVFSKDPTYADAFSTSFFILGYEKSLKIIEKRDDVAFIMIDENNKVYKSPNLDKFIEFF